MMFLKRSRMPYLPTTALTKPCLHCGQSFLGMPSDLERRKFCSRKCASLHQSETRTGQKKKEWIKIPCQQCGKEFQITPAWYRNGRRKFCSKTCQKKAPIKRHFGRRQSTESRAKLSEKAKGRYLRENSSQWKGGRYLTQSGYVGVMIEILPPEMQALARIMSKKDKYIQEHRIVAAFTAKRPLTPSEVVHHLNGDKSDNRPENLIIVDRKDHSVLHRKVELELFMLRQEIQVLRLENANLKSQLQVSRLDG